MKTIPDAALEQHIAVLGKTGSGKTNTAKLIIEQVIKQDHTICILDPIKSDWWGMTLAADGKTPGLPFHILGGPYGHVPLHPGTGDTLGRIVGTGALKHSIIDMAEFGPGETNRFFIAFAEALFKNKQRESGVCWLVLEEAHVFCPKEREGIKGEQMSIFWMKRIASAARSKGLRLIAVTQRTQALHNAVLGSCDTVIAHRMTLPADKAPVEKWFEGHLPRDSAREITADIGKLETGIGWLASGEAQKFKRTHFPLIKTYDNSSTPTGMTKRKGPQPPPIDKESLLALVGTAAKEAEANRPDVLKKRIAELEKELRNKKEVKTDPKIKSSIDQAAAEKLATTVAGGRDNVWRPKLNSANQQIADLQKVIRNIRNFLDAMKIPTDMTIEPPGPYDISVARHGAIKPYLNSKISPAPPAEKVTEKVSRHPQAMWHTNGDDSDLTKAERAILVALFWLREDNITPAKVGFYADYSPTSGSFKNALGRLRSMHLVTGWKITDSGAATCRNDIDCGDRPSGQDLRTWLRSKLSGAENTILDELMKAHPNRMTDEELGSASGYSPTSGSFKNALGRLRTIEAAQGYSRDGGAKASDVFFE